MRRKWHGFLVFSWLIPLLLVAFAILSNRQSATDPLDPPGFTPTPAPSDWLTPGNSVVLYSPPESVAERRVPINRIILSPTQSPDFFKPTSDGGGLAITFDQVNKKDISGQPAFIMHATRYGPDGRNLWDKRYETEWFGGYGISMCVFPDDSFAISRRVAGLSLAEPGQMDQLVRFQADGTLAWLTERDALPAGSLERLFARADGTVLSAGTIDGAGWVGTSQVPRVAAHLIDRDGKVITRYLQSGVGYQALLEAGWYGETGLVLLSHEEQNVDSPTGAVWQRKYKLTCLNDALEERWSNVYDAQMVVQGLLAKTRDGGLLISVGIRPEPQSSTPDQPGLIAIDSEGQDRWSFRESTFHWYTGATSLADGRLVVGQQKQGIGYQPDTALIAFVDGQPVPVPIDTYRGSLINLVATKDGGFTVIVRQAVRQLPQPPYISSIWMDTAAIVAHYDSTFRLTWRRTIDQYKHDRRTDLIVATTDDRLLAG